MPLRIVAAFAALGLIAGSSVPAMAQPDSLRRVSEAPDGSQANGGSGGGTLSGDGSLVAFASDASNLVPRDSNGNGDVFLYHAGSRKIELLTRDRHGGPTNGYSSAPDISASGRFVAFASSATDLVKGDDNKASDIFVLDRRSGDIEVVSVRNNGRLGDRDSDTPRISPNGRYVAFNSKARNLSRLPDRNKKTDVFVHDRKTGKTNRVSVSSSGEESNDHSFVVGVSNDGTRVGFLSFADNLTPKDANGGGGDAFVYDRSKQRTILASVSSEEKQSSDSGIATDLSSDGRYVVFYSTGEKLVPDDTNEESDVFLRDLETGTTERVSVASGGEQANSYSHNEAQIDASGCLITFDSAASNLVPDDNADIDIFVRDRCNDETTRMSVRPDGTEENGYSFRPDIAPDGSAVTFGTEATNLGGEDTNEADDVFLAIR